MKRKPRNGDLDSKSSTSVNTEFEPVKFEFEKSNYNMKRAYDDKLQFINKNKDYRKFLQSSVDHFRSATNAKI